MRLKILFIHNIIAPYRTPLFVALSKEYDIHVVFLERKDKNRKWSQISEQLNFNHSFLNNRNYSLFNKKITINTGLKKIIKEYNPDILVTIDNPPNFITVIHSIFLARRKKIPIIFWTGAFSFYNTFQKNSFKNKLILYAINMVRNLTYSMVDFFWAYSNETKKYLISQFQIDKKKIKVGLQGYADELIHFKEVNTKKRFRDNKLLFIGYLDERKSIDILLEVFVEMLNEFPNYTFEIIGIGKLYHQLKYKYKHIINIKFLGYLDGIKKYDSIHESKYLILPSHSDPWGWVVNEATSCEVPTLVSDAVMAKEILTDNQLIFKANSSDDLAVKLKNLMNLPYERYQELSKKVYIDSRQHTLDKSINSFNNIIKALK